MGFGAIMHGGGRVSIGSGERNFYDPLVRGEHETDEGYTMRMESLNYINLGIISNRETLDVEAIGFILKFEEKHGYSKQESILSENDRARWQEAQTSQASRPDGIGKDGEKPAPVSPEQTRETAKG